MADNAERVAGDEQVLFESRLHKKIFNRPIIIGVLAIPLLVGGLLHPYISLAGVAFIFAAAFAFLDAYLKRSHYAYALTKSRMIIRTGYLFRKVEEVPLGKVAAVYVEQDAKDAKFGTGTLVLAGTAGPDARITGIDGIPELRKLIHELLTK